MDATQSRAKILATLGTALKGAEADKYARSARIKTISRWLYEKFDDCFDVGSAFKLKRKKLEAQTTVRFCAAHHNIAKIFKLDQFYRLIINLGVLRLSRS